MLACMEHLASYNSPGEIEHFLKVNGMAPSRRFGQNFLISRAVRERIVGLLELKGGETVWEIGPGLGAMTTHLIDKTAELVLFEIDRRFIEYLQQLYGEKKEVRIVSGDVLKTWQGVYARQGRADIIFGNLPYNSAAAIIASVIEHGDPPPRMVFTVQKEVGERMTAAAGTKDYSAFTVLCSFACRIEDCGNISPGSFYPRPRVTSKVVKMVRRDDRDYRLLPIVSSFTRSVFASRRKTIRNNLAAGGWGREIGPGRLNTLLEESGIDPNRRGESLPAEVIIDFAEKFAGELPGV